MASITQSSYDRLVAELDDLKLVKRVEIAARIKEARSYGDLSENSEYDEAKNEQAKIEARIMELEQIIKQAEIIDFSKVKTDKVTVGCRVKLFDNSFDEEIEFDIVGTAEANPIEMKISENSPLGTALIGKKKGETVIVEAPEGDSSYKILNISKAD